MMKLKKTVRKMANKLKSNNGRMRGMSEEEIKEMKNEIEEEKDEVEE